MLNGKQPLPALASGREHFAKTSFSLPPRLLADLDELTVQMGYRERSKALQVAIRAFVDQSRTSGSFAKNATGTVLVLFDHTKRSVEMITQFVHKFGALLISTLQVSLPEPNYLYVMVVSGRTVDVIELERRLRKLDGIVEVKVSYITTEP